MLLKMEELMVEIAANPAEIDVLQHQAVSAEISEVVKLLGSAFGFVASAIETYMETIRERTAEFRERRESGQDDPVLIHQLVEDEEAAGILAKDEGKKPESGKIAASRQVLRLMWFWDFLTELFVELVDNPDASMYNCISTAYANSLSPRHPWVVRTTVNAALNFVPARDKMFALLEVEATPEGLERLKAITTNFQSTNKVLWEFYKSKGIDQLK